MLAGEATDTLATALAVAAPVTVNGRLTHVDGEADADWFRFTATKGSRPLVVQVSAAERLGSSLDSVLEVLDARAGPCHARGCGRSGKRRSTFATTGRRAAASGSSRGTSCTAATTSTSTASCCGCTSCRKVPTRTRSSQEYRGQRISYEDTTAEGHALLRPVYKVDVLPPGTPVAPNGLPVFDLVYRNDDGGPMYRARTRI